MQARHTDRAPRPRLEPDGTQTTKAGRVFPGVGRGWHTRMNAKQPPMTQRQPHSTPNCRTPQVKIRQQNVNKLLTAQSDLLYWLNPTEYDMAALQEPYLYHNHNSQANPHWYVIYPKEHYLWPGKTRSIILVNRQMATEAWLQVDFGSSNIMAIQVQHGQWDHADSKYVQ